MPPDKSILHRALIIGALSDSTISIPLPDKVGEDITSTIKALRQLGVRIEYSELNITIYGVGKRGLKKPDAPIDCGNSGTTARLLMGVLAAQNFESVLTGDASLSKRPMERLAKLLNHELGANITTTNGSLPVSISGRQLHSAKVSISVASAQIKSSLLLAAYCSDASLDLTEPSQSRDHTENIFRASGIDLNSNGTHNYLPSNREINLPESFSWNIPGDLSSAAFMMVAAAITRSDVIIEGVGINPSRTAVLDTLSDSGVPLFVSNVSQTFLERTGDIHISGSKIKVLRPFLIDEPLIPNLQDEIPALAALALFIQGQSTFTGASELRLKESDRLQALQINLTSFGISVTDSPDGLTIDGEGDINLNPITIEDRNDHRIAMALAVAGLGSQKAVTLPDSSTVSVSYPSFFEMLRNISSSSGHHIAIQ
jgi:3-phosphoshikimate 1-carboxyvinyltransferase